MSEVPEAAEAPEAPEVLEAPAFPEAADPVLHWARHAPDRLALVDRRADRRLTYAELDALAARWAGLLRALDIAPGDRVGALASNRAELVALFLACGRVGAALVPYNWRLAAPELAPIVADSAPRVVFYGAAHAELEAATRRDVDQLGGERAKSELVGSDPAAAPHGSWLDLDGDVPDRLADIDPAGDGAREPAVGVGPETPALVLYTSGTTGRPKGAILPHRQLFYNAVATTTGWELGPDDVAPISTPLFHTGGWNVFATPLWHRGGRVVLLEEFDPDAFLAALKEEDCTVALTVPTQLLLMQQCDSWGLDLPALRFFISGGAPCPPAVAAGVRDAGYRFKEGYGLTECGPNCFAMSLDEAERKPGAVGRPVPFLRARIVDEAGRDVPQGDEGELLLRGPQVFAGYLGMPDRTREAFDDGWLRTGDIARSDDDGVFTICGRRKEMFISGGENVYPAEVETVLSDAPDVAEVVVVGVPDEKWGEVGRAFIVLSDTNTVDAADSTEAAADSAVDPSKAALDRVRAFANERLARYKVPKSFIALPEIPRLGSGKPDRAALAER